MRTLQDAAGRDGLTERPVPYPQVADCIATQLATCNLPSCGRIVPTPRPRGGRRVYCSTECRTRHWDETHPRIDAAPTATRCEMILARLRAGPATGLELLQAGGGLRYSARIAELRERENRILGPKPWRRLDGSQETETVAPADGHDRYRLA